MNNHLKGLAITALGVLFVVPDSLFVRLITAEPMTTAFWRGMTAGGIILVALLVLQGPRSFLGLRRAGRAGLVYLILMGASAPGFVMAVTHTSVANVVFIFASIPIFAAVMSRIFLAEPFSPRLAVTMTAVMAGLGIIAYGSQESQVASWRGDLWAVFVSFSYAGALTAVRQVRDQPMIPMIPLAYIGAALVIWPLADPGPAFAAQWPLFLGHGAFIAVATCLLTLGPKYLSSAEVSLLILLESVLAPLLVWAVVGENPGRWAILGGAVVIGALFVSNMVALRRHRKRAAGGS